jgi:F-type H+-transporting ATPase subunit a
MCKVSGISKRFTTPILTHEEYVALGKQIQLGVITTGVIGARAVLGLNAIKNRSYLTTQKVEDDYSHRVFICFASPSPFENFELILFFQSFGFWFIFLFTSFNLVLFQIIVMLFNLHEFLISTFKPNSFILRLNAVLINFLFNLHCSQSYSKFLLKYFPITLTVFIFILFGNLTGLLPWSFSYTGHIGLTFSLGIILFQGWLVVGLDRLGGDFWALFIPHNCPKWLFPLMLVIEILSFVIRPFSLAIRLFANILSGHILLHLIKETEEVLRDSENNGYMNMIPSSGSSLVSLSESMVIILELGVACLQGYIFVILSSIYLQESVNERNLGLKSIKEYRTLVYQCINKYLLKID